HPLADLLGCAVAHESGDRKRAAEDRERDAGVAPAHLLADDRERDAGGVAQRIREELHRVEPDVGGLLDDRPRRLLALVPLTHGGAGGGGWVGRRGGGIGVGTGLAARFRV